jgi:AcrR family transcriptional regulator
MSDRRTEILDAALRVLAQHGMRGLTHRAVDEAAGIAPGSTSYYFRTRSALVQGCVDRLLALDLEIELPAVFEAPPAAVLDVLTGVGVAMVSGERHRTLARYELSLAAIREPELRVHMIRGGDVIRGLAARAIASWSVTDPDVAAEEIAAVLDGLVFTALLRGPQEPAALAAWLRPALERELSAHGAPSTGG